MEFPKPSIKSRGKSNTGEVGDLSPPPSLITLHGFTGNKSTPVNSHFTPRYRGRHGRVGNRRSDVNDFQQYKFFLGVVNRVATR